MIGFKTNRRRLADEVYSEKDPGYPVTFFHGTLYTLKRTREDTDPLTGRDLWRQVHLQPILQGPKDDLELALKGKLVHHLEKIGDQAALVEFLALGGWHSQEYVAREQRLLERYRFPQVSMRHFAEWQSNRDIHVLREASQLLFAPGLGMRDVPLKDVNCFRIR